MTNTNEAYLDSVFRKYDKNKSGDIDVKELQMALSNGRWTPFNPETVKLMIEMFDSNANGMITRKDFGSLWNYISSWYDCFKAFDTDKSGNISKDELKAALDTLGHKFPESCYDFLMVKFDRSKDGAIYFDDFIHCNIMLHITKHELQKHPEDAATRGSVSFTFEDFMLSALHCSYKPFLS
ncbi:unnamed protein product [Meganyctiphanes norvegica]|uniref:EF-hand domain-containing protein n=2 Tax=Meganyctiphanes norvegica TaxID=48144 RepID=A0AAV2SJC0_MEGNR